VIRDGAVAKSSDHKYTDIPADFSKWLFLAFEQGGLYPCAI
jgi:hypothetical protein